MKNLKKLITAVLAAAMVLSVAGCGSSNTPSAPDGSSSAAGGASGGGLAKITASGQPYSHTLPAWLAEQDGLYEQAGMGFEMIMFTGGAAQNEALGADEWDVGTMGSPPSITGGVAYGVHVIGFGSPDDKAVTIWALSLIHI